jgi:hypothetical protein
MLHPPCIHLADEQPVNESISAKDAGDEKDGGIQIQFPHGGLLGKFVCGPIVLR